MSETLIHYIIAFSKGAFITIEVGLFSLFFATLFGLITAQFSLSNISLLKWFALLYTTVIRGIPDLVLMLLIFFGGQMLVNEITDFFEWDYFELEAIWVGIFALAFIYGAFLSETFRGAFLQVKLGQYEAGYALGMTKSQVLRKIIFPQFALYALPGYTNNWLVLLKATALLSLIGVEDMVKIAQSASNSTHQPFIFYFAVSIIYLVLTWISTKGLNIAKEKYVLNESQI